MKAIILYDALTTGGSTDRIIDTIGQTLVEKGVYVEKAKTPPRADYSFLEEFDLIILGTPIYNLAMSPNFVGALNQSNLLESIKKKLVAFFMVFGGPELTAQFLYRPQLSLRLLNHNVIADKLFGLTEKNNPQAPIDFANEIYEKAMQRLEKAGAAS
ncbi:MAG: protochlorophyllide oxidoreductase [Chloroherpetonaceae bacterium]|nr:protochlorophyllide oxidoreductase [Chloroherpetonaceae bacterium]MCS7210183.1 protochlorophyllide oxidoreductase [Chloroherpetonaceae bacterium]MDW8019894.1 protochlorophyllide oxidoreductase [Chloroherpetonaceae bacterium]MDW8467084.1 protochlorophyllide oxidoreductase [Chloroherpetonaceae bacterium]